MMIMRVGMGMRMRMSKWDHEVGNVLMLVCWWRTSHAIQMPLGSLGEP